MAKRKKKEQPKICIQTQQEFSVEDLAEEIRNGTWDLDDAVIVKLVKTILLDVEDVGSLAKDLAALNDDVVISRHEYAELKEKAKSAKKAAR